MAGFAQRAELFDTLITDNVGLSFLTELGIVPATSSSSGPARRRGRPTPSAQWPRQRAQSLLLTPTFSSAAGGAPRGDDDQDATSDAIVW
jgi:hypothetical protein